MEEFISKEQRIQILKEQLANSDYMVIKAMEGQEVDDSDIFAKRQLWREMVTTLEEMTDEAYESYVEPEVVEYIKEVPSANDIVSQLKELVESQVESLTDEEAKKVPTLFPVWKDLIGEYIELDKRVWYNNSLYKCILAHTSQVSWTPTAATNLWRNISEEAQEADGSIEHPYTWEIGMTSYEGKYYTENNKLYLCTRDSIDPLNFSIADLINIYFSEVVN